MTDSKFRFIQMDSPRKGDLFDCCYVYSFFVEHKDRNKKIIGRIKYIIRSEKYQDVFAIKFYASRDRKSIYDKYSLAHGQLSVKGIMTIFGYCLEVMREMSEKYPDCSFVIKGAESFDPKTKKEEDEYENQRFRIYRNYLTKRVGEIKYLHTQYPFKSVYLLTYRHGIRNVEEKRDAQILMLFKKFGLL